MGMIFGANIALCEGLYGSHADPWCGFPSYEKNATSKSIDCTVGINNICIVFSSLSYRCRCDLFLILHPGNCGVNIPFAKLNWAGVAMNEQKWTNKMGEIGKGNHTYRQLISEISWQFGLVHRQGGIQYMLLLLGKREHPLSQLIQRSTNE